KIRLSLGQSAVNRDNAYAIGACALLALAFVAVVSGITLLIRTFAGLFFASLFRIFAIYAAFDLRRPLWHTLSVLKALQRGDKDQARKALSRATSKDTEKMSEQGLVRTAVEECAIALSEGGLLPLLFASFGMLIVAPGGTQNAGVCWAAVAVMLLARASDRSFDARPAYTATVRTIGNFLSMLPARLGAVMAMVSAWIIKLDARTAAGNLASGMAAAPNLNRGFVLGAYSGALRMRLGGGGYYSGQWRAMPNIGVDFDQPDRQRLPSALLLTGLTFLLGAVLSVFSPVIAAVCALLLSLMAMQNGRVI
ncbi:MAG: cobalamin biosynthesis protein, partial [Christensenellales bacterium]